MIVNQTEIRDTPLGVFIGCAATDAVREGKEIDLRNVGITILVDGHEVDVRRVLTMWAATPHAVRPPAPEPEPVVEETVEGPTPGQDPAELLNPATPMIITGLVIPTPEQAEEFASDRIAPPVTDMGDSTFVPTLPRLGSHQVAVERGSLSMWGTELSAALLGVDRLADEEIALTQAVREACDPMFGDYSMRESAKQCLTRAMNSHITNRGDTNIPDLRVRLRTLLDMIMAAEARPAE
jgi:hypothetical protein